MSTDLTDIIKAYDVRGTVPDRLNPTIVEAIGAAFAEIVVLPDTAAGVAPTVVIGHDMRESGPALIQAFASGLTRAGVNVVDIGLSSTDGLYYASGALGIPGAMFTASHNPSQYNGIKLCRASARPVSEDTGLGEIRTVAARILDGGPRVADAPQSGTVSQRALLTEYASFLRTLVDLSTIRPLTVVIDAGNGMAGHTAPAVLGTAAGLPALSLNVIPLYFELDGTFPNHEANPLEPKNLIDLQKAVLHHGADIGLAFDGDADRCFVVDERGEPVAPSTVTTLVGLREVAKEHARGSQTPTVIHNLITSRSTAEALTAAGADAVRTRVGHSFIKATMAERNAVFGGEHSAHYYFRDFFFADTGMLAAMHVLAALGEQTAALSELTAQLSPYAASGEINVCVTDTNEARARVEAAYMPNESVGLIVDELDGLTVSHWDSSPRWWFNLRASNTEPLLRLNVEAEDASTMQSIRDDVLRRIGTANG